jgi:hypothetical protein
VVKSAFWLGLVYSAMPFDLGKPNAVAPMTAAAPDSGNSLGAYASALRENADGWRSAIEVAASLARLLRRRARQAAVEQRSDLERTGGARTKTVP